MYRLIVFVALMLNFVCSNASDYIAYKADTAPTIDGDGNERCWQNAKWAFINHPFDGKVLPDSSDFYGCYKIVWTPSRIYMLVEVTDDKLIDNRVNPTNAYWEDDCCEFFFDENNKPQGHECEVDAYNAFAYHVAAVARDKNNYLKGNILNFDSPNAMNHVVDLGESCNTNEALNFDDHVNVKIKKNGNQYTWELEFKIFNDTFNENVNDNVPVVLNANKVIGYAIAYCDDDNGSRDNMIGTIENHNDYTSPNPCYRFTNSFQTLTLKDTVYQPIDTTIHTQIVNNPNKANYPTIWPNPAEKFLNIKSNIESEQIDKINIINCQGQTIITKAVASSNFFIDVSNLPSGFYILETVGLRMHTRQIFIVKSDFQSS